MTVFWTWGDRMILETDKKYLSVGFKQTMKVIEKNEAQKVYIARDCDEKMFSLVEQAVKGKEIEVFYTDTMRELGKFAEIDKGASCAVVRKHS